MNDKTYIYGPDGQRIYFPQTLGNQGMGNNIIKRKFSPRDEFIPALTLDYIFNCFTQAEQMGEVSYQVRLFEQMCERDGHLRCEKDKRLLSMQNVPFQVTPYSDDAKDVEVAEFVEQQIDEIHDWSDVLTSLQTAVGNGFAVNELFWDVSEGQAQVKHIDFVPAYNFTFYNPKTNQVGRTPFIQNQEYDKPQEIPAFRILLHRHEGKTGVPTKSGLMRTSAWLFIGKYYSLRDWLRFSEVHGMPLRLGRFPLGASDKQISLLKRALEELGSDSAGVIPENMQIEFPAPDSIRATSAQIYDLLCRYLDKAQSKVWLGQNLSTEVEGIGSYAATRAHIYVRQDIVKSDSFALANTIRSQLLYPLIGYNFGWEIANTRLPKYEPVWEEQEDLEKKSKWVQTLYDLGMPLPVSWIHTEFGVPREEEGEEVLTKQKQITPEQQNKQDDNEEQQQDNQEDKQKKAKLILSKLKETYQEYMTKQANPTIEQMFDSILKQMDKNKDLDKAKNNIHKWMDDPPLDALNELFQKGFMAAELQGMYDVDREG